MKTFQSLASTLKQGVQNTYFEYQKGYTQAHAHDATAMLEEDERERRLNNPNEEQNKEILAATTSVVFRESAIPHDSMATMVEKGRESHAQQDNKASIQALRKATEEERERRTLDVVEAESREAVAAQVSVILLDSLNQKPQLETAELVPAPVVSEVQVSEALELNELAAQIPLIENENVAIATVVLETEDHAHTREISKLIAQEALKQHLVDGDALMTPSLVSPRSMQSPVHPGIETPLYLRDEPVLESTPVATYEPVIEESGLWEAVPALPHEEVHSVMSSIMFYPMSARVVEPTPAVGLVEAERSVSETALNESTPIMERSVQVPVVASTPIAAVEQTVAPVPFVAAEPVVALEKMVAPALAYVAPTNTYVAPAPTYVASATTYVAPAPVYVAQAPVYVPQEQAAVVSSPRNFFVKQQSMPAMPVPASAHASTLATLQADVMAATNSAPSTEWVECQGQPSIVNSAPLKPTLARAFSLKELKQINTNVKVHHNDALKEARKAEKCFAKVEKYTAKGKTSKVERYQREEMQHRAMVAKHEHIVVEEKAKIAENSTLIAATPAL